MRWPRIIPLAAALVVAAPAMAQHHGDADPGAVPVSIGFSDYRPAHIDVVRGESVVWTNDSVRRHSVTADSAAFDSGSLGAGEAFSHRFDVAGSFRYHCKLHPGINGDVGVHAALLDPPSQPAAPGRPYPLHGRVASGSAGPVVIEQERDGAFVAVGEAPIADGGHFAATVVPTTSARYRAAVGGEAGPPIQLVVLDHTVAADASRRGRRVVVNAQVAPAAPGATVVLQLRLRERFGWWPVRSARLDQDSIARFRIRRARRVRARVVLTLEDRATPLATSPVVRLPAAR